jgi:hypothetical protein
LIAAGFETRRRNAYKKYANIVFTGVKRFEGGDGRTLVGLLSKNCTLFDFFCPYDALLQFIGHLCQAALAKYWYAWFENSIITYHLIQIIFVCFQITPPPDV